MNVLALFAQTTSVTFDRLVARRALDETVQAISGETWQAWASRLMEVGESVNLRIRSVECTLQEALTFANQRIPIAICLGGEESVDDDLSDCSAQTLSWVVLTHASSRRVHVKRFDNAEHEEIMTTRRLRNTLQMQSASSTCRFMLSADIVLLLWSPD